MRPIHLCQLDKPRPAVIMTREAVIPYRKLVTVAGITHQGRGLRTEVPVGPSNGVEEDSVINADDIVTVPADRIGRFLGYLLDDQEEALAEAVITAFDLNL